MCTYRDKEVYSSVSGEVIAAYDDEDDITPGSEDFKSMEGNHVYIKIEETGTYLLLNHLKRDSVLVKVEDKVKPGDLLGRVGNSVDFPILREWNDLAEKDTLIVVEQSKRL